MIHLEDPMLAYMQAVHLAMLHTKKKTPGRSVGSSPQKAVLLTLARMEGEPITMDRIAERVGCSKASVKRAMDVLELLGVIQCVERKSPNKPSRWRIDMHVLRKMSRKKRARRKAA